MAEREKKETNIISFKLGDIVATKAHPYVEKDTDIKIASFNHSTPPLMVVIEKHNASKYDPESGVKQKSYKCMFYSHINGGFEENWFKVNELKLIKSSDTNLNDTYKEKLLDATKKDLTGQQVILSTIDLEIGKTKILIKYSGKGTFFELAQQLNYLPPVAAIIDVSLTDKPVTYDSAKGTIVNKKAELFTKIRWYNNKTSKFSEKKVPLIALMKVNNIKKRYATGEYYPLTKTIELEGTKNKIEITPAKFIEAIYSHYKYEYLFINGLTGEEFISSGTDIGNKSSKPVKEYFERSIVPESHETFDKYYYSEKKSNGWYRIVYADRGGVYSTRIVHIKDIVSKNSGVKYALANCLKRNGAERYFRLDRIFEFEKVPSEIIKYLEAK